MKIEYDKIADALYIYLNKGKIAKTVKMQNRLIVDVHKNGKILGLEVLGASKQIPKSQITRPIKISVPSFSSAKMATLDI